MDLLIDVTVAVLVFATLATAWSWLGAYARVVSFGHAVFFGIGAYGVAVSNYRDGSPWYGALGAALFAVLVAGIAALLCLRGRGLTFAALTLAAGIAAEPFVAGQAWLGPHNVYAFPIRTGFLNLQFDAAWPYLVLALCVFGVAQGLTFALRASQLGYYLRALRTNLPAASAVGVNALPARAIVVAASAFVTSVAGSFFAEFSRGVAPQADFGFGLSLDIALIGIVTGSFSPWGPPLAALVYALFERLVPLHPGGTVGAAVLTVEAALIVIIAVLRPQGLFAGGLLPHGKPVTAGAA